MNRMMLWSIAALAAALLTGAAGLRGCESPPAFFDDMDGFNTQLWHKADGWANLPGFGSGWRADHVEFTDGIMRLRLDDQPCPAGCSGRPYASGEYRTNQDYSYGRVEGRLRAAKGSGLVTSLFTYTGPSDGKPHDEIDIEILGKDTTRMQANYFTNGVGGHEGWIDLGFDAAEDFHTYAFEWLPTGIKWHVDDVLVYEVNGSHGPLPSTPGKIMMNFWPGDGLDAWCGPFTYRGLPLYAEYDWIRYTPFQSVSSP